VVSSDESDVSQIFGEILSKNCFFRKTQLVQCLNHKKAKNKKIYLKAGKGQF
jgi:hypothetical protein